MNNHHDDHDTDDDDDCQLLCQNCNLRAAIASCGETAWCRTCLSTASLSHTEAEVYCCPCGKGANCEKGAICERSLTFFKDLDLEWRKLSLHGATVAIKECPHPRCKWPNPVSTIRQTVAVNCSKCCATFCSGCERFLAAGQEPCCIIIKMTFDNDKPADTQPPGKRLPSTGTKKKRKRRKSSNQWLSSSDTEYRIKSLPVPVPHGFTQADIDKLIVLAFPEEMKIVGVLAHTHVKVGTLIKRELGTIKRLVLWRVNLTTKKVWPATKNKEIMSKFSDEIDKLATLMTEAQRAF